MIRDLARAAQTIRDIGRAAILLWAIIASLQAATLGVILAEAIRDGIRRRRIARRRADRAHPPRRPHPRPGLERLEAR